VSHNIFLKNNFSYLHPNALYQPFAFRAKDMLRENSFIICNDLIPTTSFACISLKKEKTGAPGLFYMYTSGLPGLLVP